MTIALFLIGAIIFICGMGIGICARDWDDGMRAVKIMLIGLIIMFLVVLFAPASAAARDRDGRYAAQNPELHQWFEGLKSGKGACCSDADGTAVTDADWETKDGHYRVKVDGEWWDVPPEAVITEPNRVGRTMVWPIRYWDGKKLTVSIRCFMPGAMI